MVKEIYLGTEGLVEEIYLGSEGVVQERYLGTGGGTGDIFRYWVGVQGNYLVNSIMVQESDLVKERVVQGNYLVNSIMV